MADAGDGGQRSTDVVTGFTTYLRTRKGMILAMEAILCIIVLICYGASNYAGFVTMPIIELVFCVVFFIVFMLQLNKTISFIHWPLTDLIRAVIGCLCFIITSLIVVFKSDGAGIAGGVFGLIAGVLFGYDSYLTIMDLKRAHRPAATSAPDSPDDV